MLALCHSVVLGGRRVGGRTSFDARPSSETEVHSRGTGNGGLVGHLGFLGRGIYLSWGCGRCGGDLELCV
jgi:hypothetical protein